MAAALTHAWSGISLRRKLPGKRHIVAASMIQWMTWKIQHRDTVNKCTVNMLESETTLCQSRKKNEEISDTFQTRRRNTILRTDFAKTQYVDRCHSHPLSIFQNRLSVTIPCNTLLC